MQLRPPTLREFAASLVSPVSLAFKAGADESGG